MVAIVHDALHRYQTRVEPFVEKHFVKIAFAVSAFALLTFAPLEFLLGTVMGYAGHYIAQTSVQPRDKLVTVFNSLLSIIGAVGMFVRYTPGGALGGFIFQSIPAICSLSIGATFYRLHQLYKPPAACPQHSPSAPPQEV